MMKCEYGTYCLETTRQHELEQSEKPYKGHTAAGTNRTSRGT